MLNSNHNGESHIHWLRQLHLIPKRLQPSVATLLAHIPENVILPLTEDQARNFYQNEPLFVYDHAAPVDDIRFMSAMRQEIIPSLRALSFLDFKAHLHVTALADWAKNADCQGVEAIRYPPWQPIPSLSTADSERLFETAMINAKDGQIALTVGHVTFEAFIALWNPLVDLIQRNAVVQQHYYHALKGQMINLHLILHAEYNHVELFMPVHFLQLLDNLARIALADLEDFPVVF